MCVKWLSVHKDIYYYGRFLFFSFTLQALKSAVHSSFLNLHVYLQSYIFFIKIYFQITEHCLITKLLVLNKSSQPPTGDVFFKADFSLNIEVCLISYILVFFKRNRIEDKRKSLKLCQGRSRLDIRKNLFYWKGGQVLEQGSDGISNPRNVKKLCRFGT